MGGGEAVATRAGWRCLVSGTLANSPMQGQPGISLAAPRTWSQSHSAPLPATRVTPVTPVTIDTKQSAVDTSGDTAITPARKRPHAAIPQIEVAATGEAVLKYTV